MDIQSAEPSFRDVNFENDSFDHLLNHLQSHPDGSDYHLSLFIGDTDERKQKALKQIADATGREIREVDANEIITKVESETTGNLDYLFDTYDASDSLLYLKNGSRLCGVYTGYTHSRVKYATPQERYFLKKMQQKGGLYIVDINTTTDADTTIRRAAQSVINFPPSQSMFKRMIAKLKGVTMHGYEIKTDRPERYGDTAGNF